jgi:rSAM/selenodomain-associated transferase 1
VADRNVCAIMAKQPYPGRTKTRLYPKLTPQEAADLYEAMLLDTIMLVATLDDIDLAIAATPAEARTYFEGITPPASKILPVEGVDIGECLTNTIRYLLEIGYHKVVALNADGPSLPPEYIQLAFKHLDNNDIVLGPGHDGGYYLVGMKKLHREIFSGIFWSTQDVLSQTKDKISDLGLEAGFTPEWYDVDTPGDLLRIKSDLQVVPAGRLIHVRRFLSNIDL